ncbi:hypothetical protein G5C51_37605 [Streptomyces sp. A7024]|uniref:Gram-positive cocci surface proteins LPxTG domain-containing protein n=1 Tax=Streptomyces coryli TaxID=1128680 RepID=A0A6G4UBJ0_9ACTN|nr:hypothetical protein [Streptomyces coryli]NGN69589.1 hypothetical protein [Streptomyces coryli]
MRTPLSARPVTVAALAASSLLLAAPTALATNGHGNGKGDPAGDNGTVKIHDAKTGEELRKNEPHVCEFYLDAFGFDSGQEISWQIVQMPPTGTKGEQAKAGSMSLDGDGHGRSAELSLPDGHYKLIWNFNGENGEAKHKVFWTDCESDEEQPPGKPSKPGKPSEKPSDKPTVKPTSSSPNAPGAKGGKDDEGGLAETGAQVGGLAAGAAALLGAGTYLVMRRKNAGKHS